MMRHDYVFNFFFVSLSFALLAAFLSVLRSIYWKSSVFSATSPECLLLLFSVFAASYLWCCKEVSFSEACSCVLESMYIAQLVFRWNMKQTQAEKKNYCEVIILFVVDCTKRSRKNANRFVSVFDHVLTDKKKTERKRRRKKHKSVNWVTSEWYMHRTHFVSIDSESQVKEQTQKTGFNMEKWLASMLKYRASEIGALAAILISIFPN